MPLKAEQIDIENIIDPLLNEARFKTDVTDIITNNTSRLATNEGEIITINGTISKIVTANLGDNILLEAYASVSSDGGSSACKFWIYSDVNYSVIY